MVIRWQNVDTFKYEYSVFLCMCTLYVCLQFKPETKLLYTFSSWIPYPNTKLPSFLIPNWAFWTPLLSRTSLPLLTTFPRHSPDDVLKKPAFWAYRHPAALAVSSTETMSLFLQPSSPPGSNTDTVLRGSWTTVMWPGSKDAAEWDNSYTIDIQHKIILPFWKSELQHEEDKLLLYELFSNAISRISILFTLIILVAGKINAAQWLSAQWMNCNCWRITPIYC